MTGNDLLIWDISVASRGLHTKVRLEGTFEESV